MLSTSRGLAPREGLELSMLKLGHTRPSMEPRRGPQAGKYGYPRIQNTDKYAKVFVVSQLTAKLPNRPAQCTPSCTSSCHVAALPSAG